MILVRNLQRFVVLNVSNSCLEEDISWEAFLCLGWAGTALTRQALGDQIVTGSDSKNSRQLSVIALFYSYYPNISLDPTHLEAQY